MDDFKLMFCIMKILKDYDDSGVWKANLLTAEELRVSEHKLNRTVKRLCDDGYAKGAEFYAYIGDTEERIDNTKPIEITIKGLEFLANNDSIRKAGKELVSSLSGVVSPVLSAMLTNILCRK